MERIVTKRLVLRALKPSDAAAMFDYAKTDEVGPQAGWTPHKSVEESANILNYMIRTNEVWGITTRDNDTLIGTIGLHKDEDEKSTFRSLGYVLHPAYHGQGLMTEAVKALIVYAFEQTNIDIIGCGHFTDNIASQRVIEKCGFIYQKNIEKDFNLFGFKVRKTCAEYEITIDMYKENKLLWQQH
ncbi:GNAT family N-acetyltransferase [Acholeplasma manati]|uniref:GNAT family N-acetyltransferase n=1 Tax=Paracholeplasma manati TaxID=591373 RepID=A0ABT2Y6C9_9MOLU|nr:GNAT family N-acetyltransferase [Paracholeplasma manati]MCV2232296.1 GNAT family N-acetyltransferase [Paracholeplasma manati]